MISKKHVILIGMMGTGKTTVGQVLAKKTSLPWKDTDKEIEQVIGMTIAQYFSKFGEKEFRKLETEKLRELLSKSPAIITTGGGVVLKEENRKLLSQNGFVIQLKAQPEVIIKRIQQAKEMRPLLVGNIQEKVYTIMRARKGLYDFADWTIDTTELSVDQVVEHIIHLLNKRGLI